MSADRDTSFGHFVDIVAEYLKDGSDWEYKVWGPDRDGFALEYTVSGSEGSYAMHSSDDLWNRDRARIPSGTTDAGELSVLARDISNVSWDLVYREKVEPTP